MANPFGPSLADIPCGFGPPGDLPGQIPLDIDGGSVDPPPPDEPPPPFDCEEVEVEAPLEPVDGREGAFTLGELGGGGGGTQLRGGFGGDAKLLPWYPLSGVGSAGGAVGGPSLNPLKILTPPGVQIINVTDSEATATWQTNKLATSEIRYEKFFEASFVSSIIDGTPKNNHVINLVNLDPNTTYDVTAISKKNNQTVSGNVQFTTDEGSTSGIGQGITITNISFSNLTPSTVSINWDTVDSVGLPLTISNSELDIPFNDGTILHTKAYSTPGSEHSVGVSTLNWDTDYTVTIRSFNPTDASQDVKQIQFATLQHPASPQDFLTFNANNVSPTSFDYVYVVDTGVNPQGSIGLGGALLVDDDGQSLGTVLQWTGDNLKQGAWDITLPIDPFMFNPPITQLPPDSIWAVFASFGDSTTQVGTQYGPRFYKTTSTAAVGGGQNPAGFSFADPKFLPAKLPEGPFLPIDSEFQGGVFNKTKHHSVEMALERIRNSVQMTYVIYNDITLQNLLKSLRPELQAVVKNAREMNGRIMSNNLILKAIQQKLFDGTVGDINPEYLLSLSGVFAPQQPSVSNVPTLQSSEFGTPKKVLSEQRASISIGNDGISLADYPKPNVTIGAYTALNRAKLLDPNAYAHDTKELLKLWYITPPDIDTRLCVETQASGLVKTEQVTTGGIATVDLHGGGSIDYEINQDDTIDVRLHNGTIHKAELCTLRSQAHTLNNRDESTCLFYVNSEYVTKMEVTSPSALDLELFGDVDINLSSSYTFLLNTSSIEDVSDDNLFVRKTEAVYNLQTDQAEVNAAIKHRAYPWKVFPISIHDPIWNHITTSSTYKFTFNNFGTEQFGETAHDKVFVRRLPILITVVPTNQTSLDLYNGTSLLEDWNVRTIKFIGTPDPNYSNPGLLKHYLQGTGVSATEEDVNGNTNSSGFQFSFNNNTAIINDRYTSSVTPTRRTAPFREIIDMVSALSSTLGVTSGLTWNDILSRVSTEAMLLYNKGVTPTMLNKFRNGSKTGIKVFHTPSVPTGARFNPLASRLIDLGGNIPQRFMVPEEDEVGGGDFEFG